MNYLLNKEDFILYESKYVSTNENIPPKRISFRGIFHITETSYTVPLTLLRISKLGLGGSIVYV